MLPNRGLGFNGTEGLLMNSYLMLLWVCCLGNPNRHWVNRQSLLDFLSNGQEEKGSRLDSRCRDAAVPAVGQTRRTSWRLGQIRGQGTGCSCERQAWWAPTEEVKAPKKAAVVGHRLDLQMCELNIDFSSLHRRCYDDEKGRLTLANVSKYHSQESRLTRLK